MLGSWGWVFLCRVGSEALVHFVWEQEAGSARRPATSFFFIIIDAPPARMLAVDARLLCTPIAHAERHNIYRFNT